MTQQSGPNYVLRIIRWPIIIGWFLTHAYLAHHRSIWVDEWLHFDQIQWPIREALKSLFEEISPFAPGQLMLGRLFYAVTGGFPSMEFSGRLSSLLMGALTLSVAFRFGRPLLVVPVAFSVALGAMATQSRPYSAMILCGAVATHILFNFRNGLKLRGFDRFVTWFALIFGHIYGIAWVSFASLLRRQWTYFLSSAAWLSLILYVHVWPNGKLSPFDKADIPPLFTVFKQTMGAMGNPHKAWVFFLVFFCYGFWSLKRLLGRRFQIEYILLLSSMTLAPLLANVVSGYYFSPRQMVGGMFPFFALSVIGMGEFVRDFAVRISSSASAGAGNVFGTGVRWAVQTGVSLICFIFSVGPWIAFAKNIPPFIDQPLSKTKDIAVEIIDKKMKNVLWADSGLRSSVYAYMHLLLREPIPQLEPMTVHGFEMERSCWSNGTCLYTMTSEQEFTHDHIKNVNENPRFKELLEDPQYNFEMMVYTAPSLSLKTERPTRCTY